MNDFLRLKKSNCKNCYKCIRSCPVKSIRFTGNQAYVIPEECILCGQCFVVCPQNAKEIRDDTEKAKVLLTTGAHVYVSLAPSFIAEYGVNIKGMEAALKKLGFYAAEETAIGATAVKDQYEKQVAAAADGVIISSCCHTVNLLIEKYFPQALPFLSKTVTPMAAHVADIKQRNPNAKVVFIGPCLSKKDEAETYGTADCVLTFEELSNWFDAAGVKPENGEDSEGGKARFFPTSGGILKSMNCNRTDFTYLTTDGLDNCIAALKDIVSGELKNCFIEMSACAGSCIGGPARRKRRPLRDTAAVIDYSTEGDFSVATLEKSLMKREFMPLPDTSLKPNEDEIKDILARMGKKTPADELNCGCCGYNTCREKAAAIYAGKADLSMCLPFLKEKAENYSSSITENSPNGIIQLNDRLEVQTINTAACALMNIRSPSDVLGEHVIRILDPTPFLNVQQSGRSLKNEKMFLAEYGKYAEVSILYNREFNSFLCLLRDVTEEEEVRERKENITRATLETADKVVDKQMRVVQEIASLLGETAAETKIALTKLKESLKDE